VEKGHTSREFDRELRSVFPHVNVFAQNHAERIVFAPLASAGAVHPLEQHPKRISGLHVASHV